MTPVIIHRYRIPFAEIVAKFIPDAGCFKAEVVGDAVVVEIEATTDPPQPAQEATHSDDAAKGGPIARRAALLCTQGGFRAYLAVGTETEAADEIRRICGVKSRAELDHDERAAGEFRKLESGYDLWLKGYD